MSIKTRFVATAILATTVLTGTAFASPEHRPGRTGAVGESQSFVGVIVEWLRDLAARRLDQAQPRDTEGSVELKDGPFIDPNGHK